MLLAGVLHFMALEMVDLGELHLAAVARAPIFRWGMRGRTVHGKIALRPERGRAGIIGIAAEWCHEAVDVQVFGEAPPRFECLGALRTDKGLLR